MSVERRYTRGEVEFRAAPAAGGPGVLGGYAAKYETLSQNLGGFVETIARGAFDKSLADGVDVMCRYNHDDNGLLGRTSSGTTRLSSDEVGLMYETDIPDTSVGRDVAVLAERRDITQSSFAFITVEDEWGFTEQGFPLRTLRQVKLVDVAPVNTPAYLDTSTAMRSLADARGIPADQVRAAAAENRLAAIMSGDAAEAEAMVEPAAEHPLNERQAALYEAVEAVVEAHGQFDQSAGPNGAHYMADNPFAADGMGCASCVFFEGPRACEVVSGDIDPMAICKLWIIPSDLVGARSADDQAEDSQGATHESLELARRRLAMLRTRKS